MDAATSKWLAALTQVMATKRPQMWCMFGNEAEGGIESDMANELDPDDKIHVFLYGVSSPVGNMPCYTLLLRPAGNTDNLAL